VDELIELTERLLEPFYERERDSTNDTIGQHNAPKPRLVVGSIPDPLSEELPIPDDSRIIGSLVLEHGLVALLDVPMAAGQVLDYYVDSLTETGWIPYGWENAKDKSRRSTLDMRVPAQVILSFYRAVEGPVLYVSAEERPGGISQVRLTLDTKPEPPVDVHALKVAERIAHGILPELPVPIGARVYRRHSEESNLREGTHAALVCQDNISDIHAHYVGQLTQRGWTLLSSDKGDGNRWSSWVVKPSGGETWLAQLLILQQPWSNYKYDLHLVAESSSGDPNDRLPSDGDNRRLSGGGLYMFK
jgi:hypothetical protein